MDSDAELRDDRMGLKMRVQLLAVGIVLGCGITEMPQAQPRAAPANACPPEGFVEEVHAAAFLFENGTPSAARERLRHAAAWSPAPADEVSRTILAELGQASQRIDDDPRSARSETESVRVRLADWSCLTEAAHTRFHETLDLARSP